MAVKDEGRKIINFNTAAADALFSSTIFNFLFHH